MLVHPSQSQKSDVERTAKTHVRGCEKTNCFAYLAFFFSSPEPRDFWLYLDRENGWKYVFLFFCIMKQIVTVFFNHENHEKTHIHTLGCCVLVSFFLVVWGGGVCVLAMMLRKEKDRPNTTRDNLRRFFFKKKQNETRKKRQSVLWILS
jgi:hypothetical protein